MRRIFISYRRDDSKSVSSRMYDRLASEFGKTNVFKDVNVIPPGVDFREYLQKEISQADTVLVVIGTRWEQILVNRIDDPKDFVRIEIESAFEQNKLVIPVTVEGAKPPNETNLPDSIRKLAFINSAKVDDDPDFHPDMDKLIALLRRQTQPQAPSQRRFVGIGVVSTLVVVGMIVALLVLMNAKSPSVVADNNGTATSMAIPTPDATNSPLITSFGGIWLLSAPSEDAEIIGSNARPVPVVGKSADDAYYLVYATDKYAWVRLSNFTQVKGDVSTIQVVNYIAPTATPTPNRTPTPRPSQTPRPTSEFANGWSISTRDEFDTRLPSGWTTSNEQVVVNFDNSIMTLSGQNNPLDSIRRSGYFTNSGVTTVFMVVPDVNEQKEARLYFSRGQAQLEGYRYFGIEPKDGNTWYVASQQDTSYPVYNSEFQLFPNKVYELTILLQDKNTFVVTLVDRETGTRVLNNQVYTVSGDWSATVSNPITWAINPILGDIQIDRVDTLIKIR